MANGAVSAPLARWQCGAGGPTQALRFVDALSRADGVCDINNKLFFLNCSAHGTAAAHAGSGSVGGAEVALAQLE